MNSVYIGLGVEFCSLSGKMSYKMTTNFKRSLYLLVYMLPMWAECEDVPVVACVSNLWPASEANTHI